MENSYLQTSHISVDHRPTTEPTICKTNSNFRALTLPIILGTSLAVAGIFVILAAAQVVPHDVNAISSCGAWGYVAGAILMGSSVITVAVGVIFHLRTQSEEINASNVISKNTHADGSSNNVDRVETKKVDPTLNERVIGDQEFEHFRTYRKGEGEQYACARGASFFYANCDDVHDLGWGCAWRSIQICASAVNLFPKFRELYATFYPNSQNGTAWAEPGYGKTYLMTNGIASQLILYKKEAGTHKTPTQECTKIQHFSELRDTLIQHFRRYGTPVMVDDVMYAMTIVGIRITASEETVLFMADPHKVDRESGLYFVVLDKEGNQIATTGVDNGQNGLSTVVRAYFNKGWMLLFPQPHQVK